jgi:rhodanese-related sulfurtransferase
MNPFAMLFGKSNFESYPADQFQESLNKDKNAQLIDVRTRDEHNQYRIPGSKLIDVSSMKFRDEIEKLDKSKSYYVYCASGARSRAACSAMKKIGIENVVNLRGGICNWNGKLENNKK